MMEITTPSLEQSTARDLTQSEIWRMRLRVAREIALQELREAVFGWSLYVTVALGVLLSTVFVYNSLNFVASSGLLVLGRPFFVPTLLLTALATLYLALWASLAIARPRDQGALRVLFFAPVDSIGVITGHIFAGIMIYACIVVAGAPLLFALAVLTNISFPALLLVGILVSPVGAGTAVALGLFLSSIAGSSRSAMFFFGATLIVVLAVPAGYTALLSIPSTSRFYDALLFLRELLRLLRDLLDWISPFAMMSAMLDAALRAGWSDLLQRLLVGLGGCVGWGALAVWGLRRRGVL